MSQKQVIPDPSFQFDAPKYPINTKRIYECDVYRIFCTGDQTQLYSFLPQVLYGDLSDEWIDERYQQGLIKSLQMSQLSCQYLLHINNLMSKRNSDYKEQYQQLKMRKSKLAKKVRQQQKHLPHMQQQLKQMNQVIEYYQSIIPASGPVLESHAPSTTLGSSPEEETAYSPEKQIEELKELQSIDKKQQNDVSPSSSPTKKQFFSKPELSSNWKIKEEERQKKRKQERLERIRLEKQNFINRTTIRKQRLKEEQSYQDEVKRLRNNASHKITTLFIKLSYQSKVHRLSIETKSIICIQALARRYLNKDVLKRMKKEVKDILEREVSLMKLEDERSVLLRAYQIEVQKEEQLQERKDIIPIIELWQKIRKTLTLLASRNQLGVKDMFEAFDQNQDSLIDRSEMRQAIRGMGFRVTREETRRLIKFLQSRMTRTRTIGLKLSCHDFIEAFELESFADATINTLEEAVTVSAPAKEETPPEQAVTPTLEATNPTISQVAHDLRKVINDAAVEYLKKQPHVRGGGQAYKEALVKIFSDFDKDGDGELGYSELVECLASINLYLDHEEMEVLQECLDQDLNGVVNLKEFISFAVSDSANMIEIGELASQLRRILREKLDEIQQNLGKTRIEAVATLFSIFDKAEATGVTSMRVFSKALFDSKWKFSKKECTQLCERIDQDSSGTITIEELLHWIDKDPLSIAATNAQDMLVIEENAPNSTLSIQEFHQILLERIQKYATTLNRSIKEACGLVFDDLDPNKNGKITFRELQESFTKWASSSKALDPAIMLVIDSNSNGVIMKDEFITFASSKPDASRSDNVQQIAELREIFLKLHVFDEKQSKAWFINIQGLHPNYGIRTNKFLRAFHDTLMQGGFRFSLMELHKLIQHLDANRNGWITEREFMQWVFPSRDIDTLIELVNEALITAIGEDGSSADFYDLFDKDDNKLLGATEFQLGLRQLCDIEFTLAEIHQLIASVDTTNEGCLNLSTFQKLIPQTPISSSHPDIKTRSTEQYHDEKDEEYDSDTTFDQHQSFGYEDDFDLSIDALKKK